jgi:hypothetical protein
MAAYDAARRVTRAAISTGGQQLEVSRLACEGRPAAHLVSAAERMTPR